MHKKRPGFCFHISKINHTVPYDFISRYYDDFFSVQPSYHTSGQKKKASGLLRRPVINQYSTIYKGYFCLLRQIHNNVKRPWRHYAPRVPHLSCSIINTVVPRYLIPHGAFAIPQSSRGGIHQHTHQAQECHHLVQPLAEKRGTMLLTKATEEQSRGFPEETEEPSPGFRPGFLSEETPKPLFPHSSSDRQNSSITGISLQDVSHMLSVFIFP